MAYLYRWIKQFTPAGSGDESIPVHTLCKVLGIPRSTYYQRLNHKESNRERENQEITERINSIHQKSKQRYGAPKIHHLLKQEGFQVSLKRVQRLMKKSGIRSIVKKKDKPYPSKEKVIQRDNLLKQDFDGDDWVKLKSHSIKGVALYTQLAQSSITLVFRTAPLM
ncbi:IS3 family transposase [Caldalkalibacillus thermarum TA2.A1]|uniref:IS3 family transposase n=2 Tax=Caldalkalibacillus thermarum (strain TA2.A1) TaxID=986075 RepID=A0A8X8L8Y8_CALTT|nr:IS3 family transposase [Caldalkalibacillus thermarum]QZT32483.1 IS3 family transposase [Caldalkalibacillus thermarum TA2.A1]